MSETEELKEKLAAMAEEIDLLKKEAIPSWRLDKPKLYDVYWWADAKDTVHQETFFDCILDRANVAAGNCYRAEITAESSGRKRSAELRVRNKIEDINEEEDWWEADWDDGNQRKHCFSYSHSGNILTSMWAVVIQEGGVIYGCEKAIDYVVENMADDLKLILGIEDE